MSETDPAMVEELSTVEPTTIEEKAYTAEADGALHDGEDGGSHFPKSIAAARALEQAKEAFSKAKTTLSAKQWALGDALLDETGQPGEPGVRTGAYEALDGVRKELLAIGLVYTMEYLRDIRKIAHTFPASKRFEGVLWSIHARASDPKVLRAAIKAIGKDKLTARNVEEFAQKRSGKRHQRHEDGDRRDEGGESDTTRVALIDVSTALGHAADKISYALNKMPPEIPVDAVGELLKRVEEMSHNLNTIRDTLAPPMAEAAE